MADFFVSMKDEALSYQGVIQLQVETPPVCGVPSIVACGTYRPSRWRHPRFVGLKTEGV